MGCCSSSTAWEERRPASLNIKHDLEQTPWFRTSTCELSTESLTVNVAAGTPRCKPPSSVLITAGPPTSEPFYVANIVDAPAEPAAESPAEPPAEPPAETIVADNVHVELSEPPLTEESLDPADWHPSSPRHLLERSELSSKDDGDDEQLAVQLPESPADANALRNRTLEKIRALVAASDGTFTEASIPTSDVPPLAHAVAKLREMDNKTTDPAAAAGIQGKRISIMTWYEQALARE